MSSSDNLTLDALTIVLLPLTVADIKFLRSIFESWISLIGNHNDKAQYFFDLLNLTLDTLSLVDAKRLVRHHV